MAARRSSTYSDIAWDPAGFLYAAPLGGIQDVFLIDVFSDKGDFIKSIIKPTKTIRELLRIFPGMAYIGLDGKRNLFLAFWNHPVVIKSDTEGSVIGEFKIHYGLMEEEAASNRDLANKKIPRFSPIIEAIQGRLAGGFYILHGFPRTEILEFDADGKMINDYWHAKSCDYRARGFLIDEKNRTFYFEQVSPEFKIDVFRPRYDSQR